MKMVIVAPKPAGGAKSCHLPATTATFPDTGDVAVGIGVSGTPVGVGDVEAEEHATSVRIPIPRMIAVFEISDIRLLIIFNSPGKGV